MPFEKLQDDGIYIDGLYLEAARWDRRAKKLKPSNIGKQVGRETATMTDGRDRIAGMEGIFLYVRAWHQRISVGIGVESCLRYLRLR